MAECCCTQEHPLDPAVASAPRLQLGARLPPKKIVRQCSSSVSGIMENHNTHLTAGFTLNNLAPAPVNVAAFRGLLGPGGFNSLYQMSFRQWNRFCPCGLRTSRTALCSWGQAGIWLLLGETLLQSVKTGKSHSSSEVRGQETAASKIKLRRYVHPGNMMVWTQTV